jgi:hypothetical protein
LYQLEGLHPISIDNNITSIDHHNHHQTFSKSESDSTYCKTDDDDDDDDDDNDTDYVDDVDVVDDAEQAAARGAAAGSQLYQSLPFQLHLSSLFHQRSHEILFPTILIACANLSRSGLPPDSGDDDSVPSSSSSRNNSPHDNHVTNSGASMAGVTSRA